MSFEIGTKAITKEVVIDALSLSKHIISLEDYNRIRRISELFGNAQNGVSPEECSKIYDQRVQEPNYSFGESISFVKKEADRKEE